MGFCKNCWVHIKTKTCWMLVVSMWIFLSKELVFCHSNWGQNKFPKWPPQSWRNMKIQSKHNLSIESAHHGGWETLNVIFMLWNIVLLLWALHHLHKICINRDFASNIQKYFKYFLIFLIFLKISSLKLQ